MEPADSAAVKRIEMLCGLESWAVEEYSREPARPFSQCLVAVHGDSSGIVAFLISRIVGDICEIYNLAVVEALRGRGIGAALLNALECRVGGLGVTSIQLEVRASNSSARSFYRQQGFTEQGGRKGFYRNPDDDAILLQKSMI